MESIQSHGGGAQSLGSGVEQAELSEQGNHGLELIGIPHGGRNSTKVDLMERQTFFPL
jgi:hypothetical protein